MRTLLLMLGLLGAAQACPVKTGMVFNGLVAQPAWMTPVCGGEYNAIKEKIKPSADKWLETYKVQQAEGKNVLAFVNTTLKASGYTLTVSKSNKKYILQRYNKDKNVIGITINAIKDKTLLVSVLGR